MTDSTWQHASAEQFAELSPARQHQLALRAVTGSVRNRLLIGRILLGMQRSLAFRKLGAHNLAFYACHRLGLEAWEARQYYKVAAALERLPLLTAACEAGRISWSKLKMLTGWVTPENEAYWIAKARKHTARELYVLHARQLAGEDGVPPFPDQVRVNWVLEAETLALVKSAIRKIGERLGKGLSIEAGLQRLAAEILLGRAPTEQELETLLKEARRDLIAEHVAPWCPGENEDPDQESAAAQAVEQLQAWFDARAHGEAPNAVQKARRAVSDWRNPELRFNPASRYVTEAQASELRRRDGNHCLTPGCSNRMWLEEHHAQPFASGGQTVPGNLVTLCRSCHQAVHRGDLQVEGEVPNLVFRDRSGRNLRELDTS